MGLSLKMVQDKSLSFNKEVFGNKFRRKRILEARIGGIQCSLERLDSLELR